MDSVKARVNDYIAQGIVDKDQLLSDLISLLTEDDLRKALYESDYRETLDLDDLDDAIDEADVDFDEWEDADEEDVIDDDIESVIVIDPGDREWWR